MTPQHFDLLILGGGSAAYAAAAVAADAGRTVGIVEQRSPGGTCPNHGCVPSKFLIEAADTLHRSRFPRHSCMSSQAGLSLDFAQLIREKDQWVLNRRKHYDQPPQPAVHLFRGHGRFTDAHTLAVDGGPALTGDRILIATGARPVLPDVDGLADVPHWTSDLLAAAEPGEMTQLPASLLTVGGGYIALESGQAFHRFGTRVTLLVRGTQLLNDGYEPEVRACIAQSLAHEGLAVSYQAELRRVRPAGPGVVATVAVDGQERTLTAAGLLLAVGRRPNTDGLGLDAIGVRLTAAGAVEVDAGMRTSVPHVYAAGDPVGGQHGGQEATPVANVQGQVAAHNALALGPPRTVDLRVVPRAIFTDPQVATVGLTEAAARAAGHDVWAGQVPMTHVARANLMRQPDGLAKMVADRATGQVLGVSLVGPQVGEVIHEAAMALRFRATVADFADLVHVFPAVAEALKIVAVNMRKAR